MHRNIEMVMVERDVACGANGLGRAQGGGRTRIARVALALLGVMAAPCCTKERGAVGQADAGALGSNVEAPATLDRPDAAGSSSVRAVDAGKACSDFGRELQAMHGGDAGTDQPSRFGADAPTLLLLYEHYRWSPGYAHGGWYLDTAGRQHDFHFDDERTDPIRQALEKDRKLTRQQFATTVARSTERDARASPAEVAAIASLLPLAASTGLPELRGTACPDKGVASIQGFIFRKDGRFVQVPIEHQQCGKDYVDKASPEILKLAGWVHLVLHMPCSDPSWSSVFKLQ
jgi:hypothetical protein